MQIIINVDDKQALAVHEFQAALAKPVKPHKGIPRIELVVVNGPQKTQLIAHRAVLAFEGVPEPAPVVGDWVRWPAKNWAGIVVSVTSEKANIKASKATLALMREDGVTKNNFWVPISQLEIL